MYSIVFTFLSLIKLISTQENGEFWWLNDKFSNYIGSQPPPPMFEKISEMDNDENAKIVFRDNNFFFKGYSDAIEDNGVKKYNNIERRKEVSTHNSIRWPNEEEFNIKNIVQHVTENQIHAGPTIDQFVFQFPAIEKEYKFNNIVNASTQSSLTPATEKHNFNHNTTNNTVLYNDKATFALYYKDKLSENICTYMKKSDCYQNKGALNVDLKDEKKYTLNSQLICCILPMKTNVNDLQKIYFPEDTKHSRRFKRSKSTALGKGNILLFHNYAHKKQKTKQTPEITDDDYEYEDPYVNIKNHKSSHHNRKQESITKHHNSDEYHEDYSVEIPAPGLTGLYSDTHENKDNPYNVNVQHIATSEYEDEDSTDLLGYATVDPRIVYNKKRKSPYSKPLKVTTDSEEIYDVDSHTISYHSEPNFNVLQDFKLPNLTRKKVIKTRRSTTTESFTSNDSEDFNKSEESDKIVAFTANNNICNHRQVFKDCGRAFNPITMQNKQMGDTEKASHPWLAILVPTHKENKLICYATLIHPRAAITAGDCVHRTVPGEITLIAALWDLSERSRSGKRVVITLLHPQYKSGDLNNNLALVHWKKPLKLGASVIPICLANPKFDDVCMFFGWGGFDQPIRTQSRWQRATIHSCKDHTSLAGIPIPINAFCASVETRSTVTGIGGSLVCRTDGHLSAVGVAVSRDSTLILLPMYDWLTSPHIGTFIGFPDK